MMRLRKPVALYDACFPTVPSATLAEENAGVEPSYIRWERGNERLSVAFFTDSCLGLAKGIRAKRKVAWLVEPYSFRPQHYEWCAEHEHLFDAILTHNKEWWQQGRDRNWRWYPFGGSWIAFKDWNDRWPKSKLVSLLLSPKRVTEGHYLRHQVVERFSDRIDCMGYGVGEWVPKQASLRDYRYTVVLENERSSWWFTEKLLDAFSMGTVPLYWGCPDYERFFHPGGVIPFRDLDELAAILPALGREDYDRRHMARRVNMEQARQYACAEDWLYLNHSDLFEV